MWASTRRYSPDLVLQRIQIWDGAEWGGGRKREKKFTARCWIGRMLPSSGRMCELQRQHWFGTDRFLKEELQFLVQLSFLSFVPPPFSLLSFISLSYFKLTRDAYS